LSTNLRVPVTSSATRDRGCAQRRERLDASLVPPDRTLFESGHSPLARQLDLHVPSTVAILWLSTVISISRS